MYLKVKAQKGCRYLLYLLLRELSNVSYMVGVPGLEPGTFALSAQRSNLLS